MEPGKLLLPLRLRSAPDTTQCASDPSRAITFPSTTTSLTRTASTGSPNSERSEVTVTLVRTVIFTPLPKSDAKRLAAARNIRVTPTHKFFISPPTTGSHRHGRGLPCIQPPTEWGATLSVPQLKRKRVAGFLRAGLQSRSYPSETL